MTWRALAQPGRGYVLWAMDYFLGVNFLDQCANVNGAPRMRTPSRRSGARSCHAPGGDGSMRSAGERAAVCGAPAGQVPV